MVGFHLVLGLLVFCLFGFLVVFCCWISFLSVELRRFFCVFWSGCRGECAFFQKKLLMSKLFTKFSESLALGYFHFYKYSSLQKQISSIPETILCTEV